MGAWSWETVDTARGSSSGDISKLFKNESIKEPGFLAQGAPSVAATQLARESIQNSWDAARELTESLESTEESRFRIRFRFRSVTGDEKQGVVSNLDMGNLRRRTGLVDRLDLGLGTDDALRTLDDPDVPLRLLYIEEYGTTGMGGAWNAKQSKLFLALVTVGFTQKAVGAGGSYGYGKAGLVRGSRLHMVAAHTRFREEPGDPGITSRFLGVTYWGQHDIDGESFTGFARLGQQLPNETVPLENLDADHQAMMLDMPTRDGTRFDELGSTFLLPDPSVEPDDLLKAIERNWWPAVIDRRFRIEVVDESGAQRPRPMRDPDLRPFIRAFQLASNAQDNEPRDELRRDLGTYKPAGSERRLRLGTLGLKADLTGWSYATNTDAEDAGVHHASLVALVRGPRMIVEYLVCGRAQPYLRGVFLANEDIDELLRQTEPSSHDSWEFKTVDEGVDPLAPKVADRVIRSVRQSVRDFQRQIKPPPIRERDIRTPFFDELMGGFFQSRGRSGRRIGPTSKRPLSIHVDQGVTPYDDEDRIMMVGTVTLEVRPEVVADTDSPHRLSTRIRYVFDEDGNMGADCDIDVDPPPRFMVKRTDRGVVLDGEIGPTPLEFAIRSEPYESDWSGQLIVEADLVDDIANVEQTDVE